VSSGLDGNVRAEARWRRWPPPILTASGITKSIGGLIAVNDVSFDIPDQSIVSLICPNGAGKTTFFNMLTGLIRPDLRADHANAARTSPGSGPT